MNVCECVLKIVNVTVCVCEHAHVCVLGGGGQVSLCTSIYVYLRGFTCVCACLHLREQLKFGKLMFGEGLGEVGEKKLSIWDRAFLTGIMGVKNFCMHDQ